MDFDQAVRMSAGKYLAGKLNLKNTQGIAESEIKYTLEFFDDLEKDMIDDDESQITEIEVVDYAE